MDLLDIDEDSKRGTEFLLNLSQSVPKTTPKKRKKYSEESTSSRRSERIREKRLISDEDGKNLEQLENSNIELLAFINCYS